MAHLVFQLLKYFAAFNFIFNNCTANETKEWRTHTLPVYAMLANADLLKSTQCGKELTEFRQAVDQHILWSLKVIDASGEPRPGFINENNYWLGSKSQCEDAGNRDPLLLSAEILKNNSKYYHNDNEFPPFEVKFFVANFRHNSTLQYHFVIPDEDLIVLGMCLPASCLKDQLSTLLETVFRNRTLFKGELYSADFTLVEVRDLIDDHRWLLSGTFITMALILVLTFLLMIIGTAYDVLIYQKHLKKDEKYLQKPTNDNSLTIEDPKALDNSNKNHMKKLKYHRFFSKIFIAFSVYSNTKIIFSTKSEDSDILAIHGIRFLTMIWIILVHMCLYLEYFYDNKQILVRNLDGFFTQVIINGTTGVDTFFCFGSFLVAYLYFKKYTIKNIHEPNNYLNVIKLYFIALLKRFIRLTPPYMIIIGLLQIITTWYSKTSLFPIMERNHENCQSYWWRNFLYIQNLFSLQNMCMSWSWYLANDMQYFVIINFLLYLSSMYFKIAASLLGLLFTSSIILTGYISYIYNYVPTVDKIINLMDVIYYPPWIRIGPSLVGVITAFIVIKLNNKLLWKKRTIILFSILASLCNLLVLFGLYERRISVLTAAIYVALSRTVWAIGIAWLLIACCTNNGGIVNSILSWKVWIPFSRLTYAAYLINPIVISSVNFLNDTSLHFNIPLLGILGLGNVVLIYICSYIVSLMFELPYINLMKEGMKYLN